MCEFCGREDCKLTKAEVIKKGAIIESNVEKPMREDTGETPMTYVFKGVPSYYSLSALFPDEEDENPHGYLRLIFDEDEEYARGWESWEVENPLTWQTEKEFLERIKWEE